ncbi:MAG: hypothetical protein ACRDWI_09300 [Jiangellaceae bacterium]
MIKPSLAGRALAFLRKVRFAERAEGDEGTAGSPPFDKQFRKLNWVE